MPGELLSHDGPSEPPPAAATSSCDVDVVAMGTEQTITDPGPRPLAPAGVARVALEHARQLSGELTGDERVAGRRVDAIRSAGRHGHDPGVTIDAMPHHRRRRCTSSGRRSDPRRL